MLYYQIDNEKVALNRLIDEMLLYQFLTARGLQTPQQAKEEALQIVARNNKLTVDELSKQLNRSGFSIQQLMRLIEIDLLNREGFNFLIQKEITVSDKEIELEKLKSRQSVTIREIELIILPNEKSQRLKQIFKPDISMQELSKALNENLEKLSVKKGDLIPSLDQEVWKADINSIVFSQDKENIYVAKILSQRVEVEDKNDEYYKLIITERKVNERKESILNRLRKNSIIKTML